MIKWKGCGADRWLLSGAGVKEEWSCNSTCLVCFIALPRITFPLSAFIDCEGVLPCGETHVCFVLWASWRHSVLLYSVSPYFVLIMSSLLYLCLAVWQFVICKVPYLISLWVSIPCQLSEAAYGDTSWVTGYHALADPSTPRSGPFEPKCTLCFLLSIIMEGNRKKRHISYTFVELAFQAILLHSSKIHQEMATCI